jgi:hypothetical protein
MSWFSRQKFDAKPILDRYLDGHFAVFAGAAAESDVRAFEQAAGCRLPQDFVDFSISPYGGIYIAVKEEIWPRPTAHAVGPFWSFLYGMHAMGFAKDCPDWMSIRQGRETFQQQSGLDAVPCLRVIGDADVYCFDARGAVVRWHHETDELEPQRKTFAEIFAHELAELKSRKERKKGGATPPPLPATPR